MKEQRNSFLAYHRPYFWTCTITNWHQLLKSKEYKEIVLDSLKRLADRNLIEIYGFVIMPNHMHLIWKLLAPNGKEKPSASFLKDTAHRLKTDLAIRSPQVLNYFSVSEIDRRYRIWQRDPLAIALYNEKILEQKLTYIHANPLQKKWNLVELPEDYYFSSADFYMNGNNDFGFLKHYKDYA